MPTIAIQFPGGRYHATPWGYHVNEGQVEWPPCPWRLLRALIAAGYSTQGWDEVPSAGRTLIETLASVLPSYQLPQASAAHSRHYMPIGGLAKGVEKTTLVFDTWANVEQDELVIRWNCKLDEEANALFTTLVESLGYLGRSESWADCRIVSDDIIFESQKVALPCIMSECPGPDWEQVSFMAPISVETYAQWRQQQSTTVLAILPLPEDKKKPKKTLLDKRAKAMAPYPEDLLDCLQKDTNWWKKQHKWSQPPGSQRVLYWRRRDALTVTVPATPRELENHRIETILLAITTDSRNTSALPHIHRTLPQGELFHRALVGRVGKGRKIDCPELTGQQENGQHLEEGHQHAHILPLDLDGDQHLDHVLIHAKMGLGDQAQRAIRSMKRTWTKGGVGDLQVAVVGRGNLESLRQIGEPFDASITKLLGPSHGATTWISHTPMVMPRYIKKNGRNSLEGQIQAELQSRGLPKAMNIDILKDESVRLRHFVRVRKHGGTPPPQDAGYAVRLTLSKPITGPLALGYGSHFGLGLFIAGKT
ncbi:type I-U CRISPR-associated protein Csb2 [Planctomycetota bacterium]